ncbi:MAG: MBL fold metallo-hydrolase [Syntrophales bacterium]|nr:MBL fold metallo-hydrolase [Syntrophales bacterium]MDD5642372.1 MBL fold metallo-hydrolase [Syntrophales bacterium]
MTRESLQEDRREPQEGWEPSPESQTPPVEEPQHPGWLTLGQVFKSEDPFFDKFLFLLGYDYSSNIYVIKGDYLTIVDPGNDYTGFMDLFSLGYRPEDIKKVVLTHGHRDHCMGAFELLRAYPSLVENGGFELILHPESPAELKEVVQKFGCKVTEVKGGETLELSGQEWEVLYTPGHTIDGLSFYHEPSKTAFTGDTIIPQGMAEADHNAGGRLDHYLFGVKVLLQRDIANLLPGHGVPVAGLGKRVVEQTYESLMLKIIGVEKEIPWIDGAKALVAKGLLEEAVFCCDRELTRKPDNLTAMQLKAYCLTDLGRCAESLPLLHRILEQEQENIYALTAAGHALLGMGNYQESITYFDRALALNPEFPDPQMYKGMALYLSGKVDEAMDIDIFQKEFSQRIKQELDKKAMAST